MPHTYDNASKDQVFFQNLSIDIKYIIIKYNFGPVMHVLPYSDGIYRRLEHTLVDGSGLLN